MDEPETIPPETAEPAYQCPECSEWVSARTDSAVPVLECPACHAQFFIAQSQDPEEADDGAAEAERRKQSKRVS